MIEVVNRNIVVATGNYMQARRLQEVQGQLTEAGLHAFAFGGEDLLVEALDAGSIAGHVCWNSALVSGDGLGLGGRDETDNGLPVATDALFIAPNSEEHRVLTATGALWLGRALQLRELGGIHTVTYYDVQHDPEARQYPQSLEKQGIRPADDSGLVISNNMSQIISSYKAALT